MSSNPVPCLPFINRTHSSVTRNAKRIVGLRPKRSARSIHEEVVKSGQLSCKEGGNMSVCVRIAIQVEMIMHVMLGIKKNKQTKNYFTLLTNCTSMTLPPHFTYQQVCGRQECNVGNVTNPPLHCIMIPDPHFLLELGVFLCRFFTRLLVPSPIGLLTVTGTVMCISTPGTVQHLATFNLPTRKRTLIIVAVAHLFDGFDFFVFLI